MKRTIKLKHDYVYYGNEKRGYLVSGILHRFGFERDGRYVITIVKGTRFTFPKYPHRKELYSLKEKGKRLGVICVSQFDRLFFKPDGRKRYDITVKRVKTRRKR